MSKIGKGFSFWKKVRFKYKISVFNENTLEEVWGLRLSRLYASVYIFVFSIILILVTAVIIIKTPIRNYLPGYLNGEMRGQIITNALILDSLEQVAARQTDFLNNVGAILKGDIKLDSVLPIDSVVRTDLEAIRKSQRESDFVKKIEEEERYNLSVFPPAPEASGLMLVFTRPVKGRVSNTPEKSGIDIAIINEQPVLASQQGVVVYSGYDVEKRYVIQIQHEMGFLTSYMQVSSLLKKTGDNVDTGEAVAVVRGGTEASPALFHFELWQNGKRLNPLDYIVF